MKAIFNRKLENMFKWLSPKVQLLASYADHICCDASRRQVITVCIWCKYLYVFIHTTVARTSNKTFDVYCNICVGTVLLQSHLTILTMYTVTLSETIFTAYCINWTYIHPSNVIDCSDLRKYTHTRVWNLSAVLQDLSQVVGKASALNIRAFLDTWALDNLRNLSD